jgi:hypothetical protein
VHAKLLLTALGKPIHVGPVTALACTGHTHTYVRLCTVNTRAKAAGRTQRDWQLCLCAPCCTESVSWALLLVCLLLLCV